MVHMLQAKSVNGDIQRLTLDENGNVTNNVVMIMITYFRMAAIVHYDYTFAQARPLENQIKNLLE